MPLDNGRLLIPGSQGGLVFLGLLGMRPQFVSSYNPDVVDSPPGVFDALASVDPKAAWHAAEAVRIAAEDRGSRAAWSGP